MNPEEQFGKGLNFKQPDRPHIYGLFSVKLMKNAYTSEK